MQQILQIHEQTQTKTGSSSSTSQLHSDFALENLAG